MRRTPTVAFKLRMTPTMRARIQRFTKELELPTESSLVLLAVATFLDRQIALRGEVFVEVPTEIRIRNRPRRRSRNSTAPGGVHE